MKKTHLFLIMGTIVFCWQHSFKAGNAPVLALTDDDHYRHLIHLTQLYEEPAEEFKEYVEEHYVDVHYVPDDWIVRNSLLASAVRYLQPKIVAFLLSHNASTDALIHVAAAEKFKLIDFAFNRSCYDATRMKGKQIYTLLKLYGASVDPAKIKEWSLRFENVPTRDRDTHELSVNALALDPTLIKSLTPDYCYRLIESVRAFTQENEQIYRLLTNRYLQEEPEKNSKILSNALTKALGDGQQGLSTLLVAVGIKIEEGALERYVHGGHNLELLKYVLSQGLLKDDDIFGVFKRAIWASRTSAVECVKKHYDYADPSRNSQLLFEAFTCPTSDAMVPAVAGYMRHKSVAIDVKKTFPALDLSPQAVAYHAFERGFFEEAQWLVLQGATIDSRFFDFISCKEAAQRKALMSARILSGRVQKSLDKMLLQKPEVTYGFFGLMECKENEQRNNLELAVANVQNAQAELEKTCHLRDFLEEAYAAQQTLES